MGVWNHWNGIMEWNAGMEWWNAYGITKQGSQNSAHNSRVNRVGKKETWGPINYH